MEPKANMTSLQGLWNVPKKLGEKIKIIDEGHVRYGQEGYKQASRPDGKVMVFIYITKKTGTMVQLEWEQCERI